LARTVPSGVLSSTGRSYGSSISQIASPTLPETAVRALGLGPAVVAVFLSRLAGGVIVGLVTAVIPITGRSYSYGSWNRYVFGYSLAASIVAAFFLPWLLRMFRHEIS
jgi:hypothetical protein